MPHSRTVKHQPIWVPAKVLAGVVSFFYLSGYFQHWGTRLGKKLNDCSVVISIKFILALMLYRNRQIHEGPAFLYIMVA